MRKYTVITLLALCAIINLNNLHANGPMITAYVCTPPRSIIAQSQAPVPTVGGIPFSCAGYLDYSNTDGFIGIPKHHTKQNLRIVVSAPEHITFVKAQGQTISHPQLIKEHSAQVYRVKKEQDEKKDWFYKAEKESAPQDNKLHSTDLIIFTADPNSIYINTKQSFFAVDGEQFALPQQMITVLWDTKTDVQELSQFLEAVDVSQEVKEEQGENKTDVVQSTVSTS